MLSEVFFIILILLVAFLIGFLVAWFLRKSPKNETVVNVNNDEDHLSVKLLNDKIYHKDQRIAELERDLADVEFKLKDAKGASVNAVADLTQNDDKIKAELDAANLKLAEYEAKLTNSSDGSEYKTEIADLKGKLDSSNTKIADLEAKLKEAQNAGTGNDSELADLKNKLASANAKISEHEASLADKSQKLEACELKLKNSNSGGNANKFVYKPLSAAEQAKMEAKAAADPNFPKEKLDIAVVKADYASDKDDLKLIKGVGPYIEFKMNALGIQNFQQVMNFTKEDVEIVTDAIKFFPGRIERDNWISQAAEFYKEKNSLS